MSEAGKNKTTLITFVALMILILAMNVWMMLPYLMAILMGAILSLLFGPVFKWMLTKRIAPGLAAALTTILILFAVIGPVSAFAVRAVKQGVAMGTKIADNPDYSIQSIIHSLSEWGPVDAFIDDPAAFEAQARAGLKETAQSASGLVLKVAAQIPSVLLQLVIALLTCLFLLKDGRRFTAWMSDKIPLEREVRKSVSSSFKDTAVSVIWATLAAAAGQAMIIMAGFLALGIPNVALAGGATFIFAWIPMIGCTPVWLAGAIYLYFQDALVKAVVMVVIGLVAGIADNFIRPIVLKGRSEMHPLVSLIAIFGGIKMFGLLGVFVGPIVIAILITFLNAWPDVSRHAGMNFKSEKIK